MSDSIIGFIKSQIDQDILKGIGQLLKEKTQNVQIGLEKAIASYTTGLLVKSSSDIVITGLEEHIAAKRDDSLKIKKLPQLIEDHKKMNQVLNEGDELVDLVLESKAGSVIDFIQEKSNLNRSSSSSILKISAALINEVLGSHAANSKKPELSSIRNTIIQQKSYMAADIESAILDIFNLDNLEKIGKTSLGESSYEVSYKVRKLKNTKNETNQIVDSVTNILLPLLLILFVAFILFYFSQQF